jgi:phospholipid/cholesterol/gamma-HCH transport system substrate-binding protein
MISSTVRLQPLAFIVVSVLGVGYVSVRYLGADGPTPTAGSMIPASRVGTPVPMGNLIANLDTFLRSVPLDSLRTVVDELGTGFTGTGPALQTLLDTSDEFTRDAITALPQTVPLIRDGRVVLQTQNEQSSEIISSSQDLALLAAQLWSSDPDIRQLIRTAPRFSAQTSGVIQDSGSQIGHLLADLLTVSRIALPRQAALRQLLATYPPLIATDSVVVPGDGFAHLGLVLNVFDPYACVRGYEDTTRRPGTNTTPIPANRNASCAEPPGSPTDVRGAQNVPRAGVPVAVAPGDSRQPTRPAMPHSRPPNTPITSLASILER